MKQFNELRQAFVMQDGEWLRVQMGQIEKGDIFKINEPDGTPVEYEGCYIFQAVREVACDATALPLYDKELIDHVVDGSLNSALGKFGFSV